MLSGVWRLRLPLELPGVPHCNAWALQAGDGIVLVDTGMHDRGSFANLEAALSRTGHSVRDISLVVITHAHIDHCGQAPLIAEKAGCEVWMHPAWKLHATSDLERTLEIAVLAGVPDVAIQRFEERRRGAPSGQYGELHADRDLVPGVTVKTNLGEWHVIETPGHAPSHVCLHQPESRVLITGDHLLGRVSQYFDVGYTPDPVGEFLTSLERCEGLGARLALAGHARPFTDIGQHVEANRVLVDERLAAVRRALRGGPLTAYELAGVTYGDAFNEDMGVWLMALTRAWLTHLQAIGEVVVSAGDPAERWALS